VTPRRDSGPVGCVLGDMDLVRPLGLAGISCAVVAGDEDPQRFSRFACARIEQHDGWADPEAQVATLLRFGAATEPAPILFYESDADLLMLSRHREVLAERFRFVIAEPGLVEDLLDKARFHVLAGRLGLPVPRSEHLRPEHEAVPAFLELPVLVKPVIRRGAVWNPLGGGAKACRVDTREQLDELWQRLAAARVDVLAQELVAGPESRIESYHVYVDDRGDVAGEFTGAKIRTNPPAYGRSTALTTTDAPDVARLGRDIVGRLGLRGVAKLDFKRAPDDTLVLLEINPRFNLWHHLGAVAGVNLPALVYADLGGFPRPPVARARAGVTWSLPWHDVRAARSEGDSILGWAAWTATCSSWSALAFDDPMPFLRGHAWGWLRRRLARARRELRPVHR
jgi:D-aspartate ligase